MTAAQEGQDAKGEAMTKAEWIKAAKFCKLSVAEYKAHLKATRPHLLKRLAEARARKQSGYF